MTKTKITKFTYLASDCRFWWIRCLPAACLFDCRRYDLFSLCCHYKSKPFNLDSEALPEYQAFRSSQDYQFLPRNDKMNPTESTRTTTTTVSTFKFNFNSECNAKLFAGLSFSLTLHASRWVRWQGLHLWWQWADHWLLGDDPEPQVQVTSQPVQQSLGTRWASHNNNKEYWTLNIMI